MSSPVLFEEKQVRRVCANESVTACHTFATDGSGVAGRDVCCKLETGGNAKGNPQKCKGEIPGIAKGH